MSKTLKEAAEFLERTDRAVERYVSQGKLSATKEWRESNDGKKRKVLVFDDHELERFKQEMEAPKIRPTVERPVRKMDKIDNANPFLPFIVPTNSEQTDIAGSGAFLHRLVVALESVAKGQNRSTVEPKDKLVLTVKEAHILSGISLIALRTAIRENRLPVVTGVGRGQKIKREDLEIFIRSL